MAGKSEMAVDSVVNEVVERLETERTCRLAHLENLQRKFNECHSDIAELQDLCRTVDGADQKKVTFSKLISKLEGSRVNLDDVVSRETLLYTPQQYEATFERKLFSNTLGLDIRLTQDRQFSLVVKHVDHKQPERQFRVTLDITETGHWEVVSLEPHVHGVDELLQRLNSQDGTMTQFCKSFRQKCQHYTAH